MTARRVGKASSAGLRRHYKSVEAIERARRCLTVAEELRRRAPRRALDAAVDAMECAAMALGYGFGETPTSGADIGREARRVMDEARRIVKAIARC